MILIINTVESNKILVALAKGDVLFAKKEISREFHQTEKLLPAIDSLLKSKKIGFKKLKGIIAVKGPGGFSSVRAGVVVGNTMAWALNIPIIGFKLSEFKNLEDLIKKGRKKLKEAKPGKIVLPFYDKEPNIGKPKK